MKVWITKYALTTGVIKVDAVATQFSGIIRMRGGTRTYHGDGRDWHRTRKSAIDRVEEMRGDAIAAAEQKITKLKVMEIEVPE